MTSDSGLDEVTLEIRIAASPQTVFRMLTDPVALKVWLAGSVQADARPGGAFVASGPGLQIEGSFVEVVPHERVVFTWGGVEGLAPGQSTVEFRLVPEGEGTLLRLRHYRLPRPVVQRHRIGWAEGGLIKLKDMAEGRPPATPCFGARS